MVKFYGMLSTVTLTLFLSGEVLIPMTARVSPVQALEKEGLLLSQNNLPPQSSDGGSRYADTSWRDSFFNNQPPESGDGGSRGGPLCPLTPLDKTTGIDVWNDRPMFVWQGQLARVELYRQNEDESIWSQDLDQGDQQVQYTGVPLKPGQTYNLMLYETVSDNFPFPAKQVTFTVMDGEKRQQVSQELEQLNRELEQPTLSDEMIALVRFNYLAEKQLWSDALAEAFSVENPTKELQELRERAIPQKFCN